MDDVLKGVLDLKEYPYSAKRRFGTGNKVASGSLRASIMVVPTSKKGVISFQIFANDYFQWIQSGRAAGKKGVQSCLCRRHCCDDESAQERQKHDDCECESHYCVTTQIAVSRASAPTRISAAYERTYPD